MINKLIGSHLSTHLSAIFNNFPVDKITQSLFSGNLDF